MDLQGKVGKFETDLHPFGWSKIPRDFKIFPVDIWIVQGDPCDLLYPDLFFAMA